MSAVLTENGFIDHAQDAKKLADPAWRQKVAAGHAQGLAAIFGFKSNPGANDDAPQASEDTMHRVIVDGKQRAAFREDANVVRAVKKYLNKADVIKIEKVE